MASSLLLPGQELKIESSPISPSRKLKMASLLPPPLPQNNVKLLPGSYGHLATSDTPFPPRKLLERNNFKIRIAFQAFLLILLGYLWFLDFAFEPAFVTKEVSSFSWSNIPPTSELVWYDCFDDFHCARLEVPLDWTDSSNPHRVAIAMVKVPAAVPEDSPGWDGPVLINPGGPGGSGTEFALEIGRGIQAAVGNTHSVIGFDPRGILYTTPATSCFPDDASRVLWLMRTGGKVLGYSNDTSHIATEYARAKSLGEVCSNVAPFAHYAGTPNVARDMLAIVEAAWNWAGVDGTTRGLRFWGFSYGTVLGQTFASMFPDRVERVVVDGVVDIDDYYSGGWRKNLPDADKIVDRFYAYCSLSRSCALHAPTPAGVEARLNALLARTKETPIPVYSQGTPDWISDSDIRTVMYWALYKPVERFPIVAKMLAALEKDDGSLIAQLIHFKISCQCPSSGREESPPNTGVEADSAILCQDGGGNNATIPEFADYVSFLTNQSSMIGGNWARIQMACTGWRVPAAGIPPLSGGYAKLERQGGKWGAERTANPLLFVSTELDPVTPLQNAETGRKRFGGAGLLVQKSEGHCSLSAPSSCFVKELRRYFSEGTVAADRMDCASDSTPWGVEDGRVRGVERGDVEVQDVVERLVEKWVPVVPGMRGGDIEAATCGKR